jgi:hypothetical protein
MPQVKSIMTEVTYDMGGNNLPNNVQFGGRHLPLAGEGDFDFIVDVSGFANISQVMAHVSQLIQDDAASRGLTVAANEIWMLNLTQG